jgi:predicted aldo/keto reductase-like oxidoreductase
MNNRRDINGKLTRREFIAGTAAAAAAAVGIGSGSLNAGDSRFHAIPSSPLPTRAYGKTGARIPILTFGCGSRWQMYDSDDDSLKALQYAIDNGVRFLDTAHNYGDGHSEEKLGMIVPGIRKQVLVQTKIATRDPNQWRKDLETSLKRMKIDYLDMCLIHSLTHDDDLEALEVKGGAIEQLYKAKEEGLTRWIGVSSHTDSGTMAKFLRRHQVDAIQMALNVATNGPHDLGFEETALPVAIEQGIGITAMKVMGQDLIVGKYDKFGYDTCLRYSMSLPVTACTVGMPKMEHVEKNLAVAKNFKPFSPEEMAKIKSEAAGEIKTSFIEGMAGHSDFA